MNIAVRYFTRSGNTEKLAQAVAKAAGAEALNLSAPLESKADILFLGCSYYAFDMDPSVKTFLTDNKDKIGKVAVFGTSAMMKSMKKPMKRALAPLGIALAEDEFHCRGEFHFANKGRPNEEDLLAAQAFVQKVLSKE